MRKKDKYNEEIITDTWIMENIPGFDSDERIRNYAEIREYVKNNLIGKGHSLPPEAVIKEIITAYDIKRKQVLSKNI